MRTYQPTLLNNNESRMLWLASFPTLRTTNHATSRFLEYSYYLTVRLIWLCCHFTSVIGDLICCRGSSQNMFSSAEFSVTLRHGIPLNVEVIDLSGSSCAMWAFS